MTADLVKRAREAMEGVRVKPLDLSNVIKHAFLSGVTAARSIPPGEPCCGPELWVDYEPYERGPYARVRAALDLTPSPGLRLLGGLLSDAANKRLKEADGAFNEGYSAGYSHVHPVTAKLDAVSKRIAELEAENARLREVAEWFEEQRLDAIERSTALRNLREDVAVKALCEEHGYGAVIDSAARQWALKDDRGAFFVGGSIGDTSARAALGGAS